MRRVLTLACAICFLAATGAISQGYQGKMLASGYIGYTLGFGEPFDEALPDRAGSPEHADGNLPRRSGWIHWPS